MSMKILIDTCVLISASLYVKYKECIIKEDEFDISNKLFSILRERGGLGYITKTVEDESKDAMNSALDKSLKRFLKGTSLPFKEKYAFMSLQETIFTSCKDRMESLVEECTSRPIIDIHQRKQIKKEVEQFFIQILPDTEIYKQPPLLPRILRGIGFRRFLKKEIVKGRVGGKMIYPGRPKDDDMLIMAEATFIYRTTKNEEVYIASNYNHFVPNRIFIASFLSPQRDWTGEFDPRVRDALKDEFGFIGERPENILEILGKTKS